MPATLIDYVIALGLLLVAFGVTVSYVTSFSTSAQHAAKLATLELQAESLLELSERSYAFDSISGLGLATAVTNTTTQTASLILSATSLQSLASRPYNTTKEDFDFRIRILDGNTTVFSYGQQPPLTDIIALQKPVLYQSGATTKRGTFMVEVW